MTHIKKTIKNIRRPRSANKNDAKAKYLIGASVDDAKSSLAGNHRYSVQLLDRALQLEVLGRNRATMIQLLKRAVKKIQE